MRKYKDGNLVEITCNRCGYSVDVSEDEHGWDAEPFREFDLVYGYGSVLYDFSGVRFDLCEHCLSEIVSRFKHEAESRDYDMMQGYNSEGKPFVYYGFTGDREMSQEEADKMYEEFNKGRKK